MLLLFQIADALFRFVQRGVAVPRLGGLAQTRQIVPAPQQGGGLVDGSLTCEGQAPLYRSHLGLPLVVQDLALCPDGLAVLLLDGLEARDGPEGGDEPEQNHVLLLGDEIDRDSTRLQRVLPQVYAEALRRGLVLRDQLRDPPLEVGLGGRDLRLLPPQRGHPRELGEHAVQLELVRATADDSLPSGHNAGHLALMTLQSMPLPLLMLHEVEQNMGLLMPIEEEQAHLLGLAALAEEASQPIVLLAPPRSCLDLDLCDLHLLVLIDFEAVGLHLRLVQIHEPPSQALASQWHGHVLAHALVDQVQADETSMLLERGSCLSQSAPVGPLVDHASRVPLVQHRAAQRVAI
mmetsp:Transcript_123094/g.307412  ORF Transcript_123094/g.307412 Transcript_123094/m.307412 type:complete len:348 (+) Transcript_123094:551-1594(+)